MFHALAAKALILVVDAQMSVEEALHKVLNKMPACLKHSMIKALTTEVQLIVYGEEVIELTEEVPVDDMGARYGL
jgi:hypothetical protein